MDEDRPDPSVGGSIGENEGGGGGGVGGRMGEAGRRSDDDGVDAGGGGVVMLALGNRGEAFVDLLTEDDFFGESELEG